VNVPESATAHTGVLESAAWLFGASRPNSDNRTEKACTGVVDVTLLIAFATAAS
jgi:hypothetical protein